MLSSFASRDQKMKAVAYQQQGVIDRADTLVDVELPIPEAQGYDLLVKVAAISVNPVDTKVRRNLSAEAGQWKVLGWDATGTVVAVGDKVGDFKVGDEVWYAGDITRAGTNAEYHVVDERIVGHKPQSLSFAEAAALPLTAITAWEMLFDRLRVQEPVAGAEPSILIIGAAGGVGSVTLQLLKAKTDLQIIATASRPETQAWVKQLGADAVLNHHQPLQSQFEALGLAAPSFVFSIQQSHDYVAQIAELIAPQGRFGLIDDPEHLNIMPFKRKSVSIHWESMFTRSTFQTADISKQSELLNEVVALVDAGKISTTLTEVFGKINAENLKQVHALLEQGIVKGKIVLEGF